MQNKAFVPKVLLILCLFIYLVGLVHKGNNRLSILFNHGIWLPNQSENIQFNRYAPFLVMGDDFAKSTFSIDKQAFEDFIKKLSICPDTPCNGISPYLPIANNFKFKYPFEEEFESSIGDFLVIRAKEEGKNRLTVSLYTDWN